MAIDTYLKEHKNIEYVLFGFDNDFDKKENYGQDKAKEFGRMYKEQGYKCFIHKPTNKDFNDDLVKLVTKKKYLNEQIEDDFQR